MDYVAHLHLNDDLEGPGSLVMTGTSTGKGEPSYVFAEGYDSGYQEKLRKLLAMEYESGLYGTGSIGQVREMVHAMDMVGHPSDMVLVVPKATDRKIEQEAAADEKKLPEGAVN